MGHDRPQIVFGHFAEALYSRKLKLCDFSSMILCMIKKYIFGSLGIVLLP